MHVRWTAPFPGRDLVGFCTRLLWCSDTKTCPLAKAGRSFFTHRTATRCTVTGQETPCWHALCRLHETSVKDPFKSSTNLHQHTRTHTSKHLNSFMDSYTHIWLNNTYCSSPHSAIRPAQHNMQLYKWVYTCVCMGVYVCTTNFHACKSPWAIAPKLASPSLSYIRTYMQHTTSCGKRNEPRHRYTTTITSHQSFNTQV